MTAAQPRVGIADIAGYLPPMRRLAMGDAARFGVDETFIAEKIRFQRLAVRDQDEDCVDLAEKAVRALVETHQDLLERIGLVVVVTQNPDGYGLPHASALLTSRLGLAPATATFDVGLGCSGWVYGLSIAASFMDANGIKDGLLVTGDPYSKVVNPDDRDTAMLFGDAAAATWLSSRAPRWRLGRFVFGTDGSQADALCLGSDRRLRMNGRGVFTFSETKVPPAIEQTMAANRLEWADVDHVILHQGSRYIVDTIGKRIGQSAKTPFVAANYGNAVSSSIPLALALAGEPFHEDSCIVVAGFGVGLLWESTALIREARS